mmetsp:Transcript_42889/g.135297  ORF Transcript_42889/g.135297 Transcript_42889/m.135297 type:complete len:434 (-) Transcript_42889:3747-5048(-)
MQVEVEVEEVGLLSRDHALVVIRQPAEKQQLRVAVNVAGELGGELDGLGVDHGHAPDEAGGYAVEAEELDHLIGQQQPAPCVDQLVVPVIVLVLLLRVRLRALVQHELLEEVVVQQVLGSDDVDQSAGGLEEGEELLVPHALLLRLLLAVCGGSASLRGLVFGEDALSRERLHQLYKLAALALDQLLRKPLHGLPQQGEVDPLHQQVLGGGLGQHGALAEELVVGDEVCQPLPRLDLLLLLQLDRPFLAHHRHLRSRHLSRRPLAGLGEDLAVGPVEGDEGEDAEEASVGSPRDEDAELVAVVVEEADLAAEREALGVGEGHLHRYPRPHDAGDGAEGEGEGEGDNGCVSGKLVLDVQVVVAVVDDEERHFARDAAGSRWQEHLPPVELQPGEGAGAVNVDGEVGGGLGVEKDEQLAVVLDVGGRHEVNFQLQ